ncbi:MAG TPA: PQQ-dependent sugar dehydrogenase [Kofleriaceae bacterium]|nr:PQQ-dependent sugar dehydrogenase [Kofleriaceae bacterium]
MRSKLLPPLVALIALIALAVCGDDGPVSAPFGLDTRPANPTCVARKRPVLNTGVKLQQMWTGVAFSEPIYLTQAPGDRTHWYVVQRGGKIRVLLADGTQLPDLVASVADLTTDGEGGLLGLAFHPQWPARHEAYLSFTRAKKTGDPVPICNGVTTSVFTSVVARYQSSSGATLDSGPDEILKVGQPFANHNGGTIQFGRDGMLYFGLGDGGDGNDTCRAGQNLGSPLGKFLRIDINAPAGMYKVPPDNPFVATAGALKEIWSYGHRNPWRWSFDQATGDLWLGEVGQNTWEEVDRVMKGGNYGWNTCEGLHVRGSTAAMCNTPGLIDPLVEHGRGEASSITGGYVYRGTAMPSLVGTYIYGDYGSGNIWALTYDADNKPTPKVLLNVGGNSLASFGQDLDGEIYTVQINGTISKLVPSGPQPPDDFPQLLSQTGCVDPDDPSRPADGLIPYDVNAPLWSDGADKQRWLAIPDGKTIAITAEQDWDLPIGSVAMKTFSVGGRRVETRLFMRHDDGGWAGYTYEWSDDGADATLLPANKLKALGAATTWAYPSRSQCIQCHSKAAGGTIGLETAQLNRDGVYPTTNRRSNQLATLDHIGMFSAPLGQAADALPRLADPAGKEALDARARSYLHGNCSHCHRPMGGGQGTMDLRFAQALADTHTCNADTTQGPVGTATVLIAPGAPEASVLALRLHASDAKRMPPVAVSVSDPLGTQLVDDWIKSLTACP